jgi:AraC family transcriptional regulator, arabinose operon regulatory protein
MISIPETSFIATNFYSKIKCEPDWKWPRREQPLENFDLFYVWDGYGEVIVNDTSYSVEKGSCFLFRPGDHTSATHDKQNPLTITYIHFNIIGYAEQIPAIYRLIMDPTNMETLLSRYIRLRLSTQFGSAEEARLILKQMMIHLLRYDQIELDHKPQDSKVLRDRILEIANFIKEHPSEWYSVADLANRAQLSERYFASKFKHYMGKSVQEYEIQSRVERAEFLLHYSGMTVSEVAHALGYKDIYFFSKQFKKHYGQSPSSIR